MDRLTLILSVNPTWGEKILNFIDTNPEFSPYLHLASLTAKPVGFGKNPGEEIPDDSPITINEYLLYYVAHAGVHAQYGKNLWLKVRGKSADEILEDNSITSNKKSVLISIKNLEQISDYREIDLLEIKGVGSGAKRFIKLMFSPSLEIIDSTDLYFKKGFQIIYSMSKRPTEKQIQDKAINWGKYKIVGTMFCNQVASYL